jgi:hypothetical protein
METTIKSSVDDMYNVQLEINSTCPHIQQMAAAVPQVSALAEIRKPMTESAIYLAASAAKCHTACPVPSAIIKAVEVAAGLALPKDVQFTISKD